MFESADMTNTQQDAATLEQQVSQYLGSRYGQRQDTHERYAEAIRDCSSIEYLEKTISEIARLHGLNPEALRNQLRCHYPDVIPNRDRLRQSMGLNKTIIRGLSPKTVEKYSPAIMMLRNTSLTVREVAQKCKVSYYGLQQHLLYYHMDIAEERLMERVKAIRNPHRRGDKDSNNRTIAPRKETEELYAKAIELYRTTDRPATDIAIECGVVPKNFIRYINRWHRDNAELRRKIRRETVEAYRQLYEERKAQSRVVKAERKYTPALALIEAGDTYDEAASKVGVPKDRLSWWVRKHRPDLHEKARNNAWVTLPNGTRVSTSGWPKYIEAAKAYCETNEPINHIARRLDMSVSSLGTFLRTNYPDFRQKRQQGAADKRSASRKMATRCITLLLCLWTSVMAYGQHSVDLMSDTLTIHFQLDSPRVDMRYADNALNWLTFEQRFREWQDAGEFASIQIDVYAGASPEGPALHNWQLGQRRGQSVRQLLLDRLGDRVGRVVVHNEAARWDGFYDLVARSNETWRDEVLRIIELPPSTDGNHRDHREQKLRNLHDGHVWPVLLEKYLAPLRNGATAIVHWMSGNDTIVVCDTVFLGGGAQDDALRRDAHLNTGDTDLQDVVKHTADDGPCWQPLLALKTNLLFDALLTPNLELEAPIGWSRWSVMAEWWTPWYRWHGPNLHNRAYELFTLGAELRYWLSPRKAECPRLLRGVFAGVYGAGGKYDVQPGSGNHEGWQGEFWSAGLSCGYSWWAGRNWRFEASLSAGYVGGPQRYYNGMFQDGHLIWQHNRHFDYFGPTKLKLTLSYLLGRTVKEEKGGRL